MERSDLTEQFSKLTEAVEENGPDRIEHFLVYHKERAIKNSTARTSLTGLVNLDGLMEGFRAGELNVISGPTGNGKTLFADTIGYGLMKNERMNIAWFSYEVPSEQMIQKYVNDPATHGLGLHIPMELKAGNMEWIKKKCLEAQLKYNCQAVFIDHLHFLVDMGTRQNMSLNIGGVMRQMKHEVAKAMNLMVFIICHQGQPKEGEPSLENIRDSSFIGQEADNVFIVYRNPDPLPTELRNNAATFKDYPRTYSNGIATVKIEKARRSGTYRRKVLFQKVGHWLEEML